MHIKTREDTMELSNDFNKLRDIYSADSDSGFIDTYINSVRFFWSSESTPQSPLLYARGIVILGQGQKIGNLNGKQLIYNKNNYLISSVPTALECETQATKEKPVLGIYLSIDTSKLNGMIDKVKKHYPEKVFIAKDLYCGVEPIKIDQEMSEAVKKLLTCLTSKLDSDVLGQNFVDEIVFRALLGPHGEALVALSNHSSEYSQIDNCLQYIHQNYKEVITVKKLAKISSMSEPSFYRSFKIVTGDSPMQYLKKIRLSYARGLIVKNNLRVNEAAAEVGYDSVSQFSREFKRHFKVSPSQADEGDYAYVYK